jgi:hypothetical protein
MRFSIRDVLWLMVAVGLAVGWCVEHRTTSRSLEACRSELSDAQSSAEFFLQSSHQNRRDVDALKAVIGCDRSGKHAGEELVWNKTESALAVDVEIPLGSKGSLITWDGKRRPPDGKIPEQYKPAYNCLGAVVVSARGHIPIRTGLMTIRDSPPKGLPGNKECVVRGASEGMAQIILPELFRSLLGPGQHCVAIYGGRRDDTTTFAAQQDQLDTEWQFFSVSRLTIVP